MAIGDEYLKEFLGGPPRSEACNITYPPLRAEMGGMLSGAGELDLLDGIMSFPPPWQTPPLLEKTSPTPRVPCLLSIAKFLIVFRFRLSNRYVLRNGVLFHVSPFLSTSPGPGSYAPPIFSSTVSRSTTAKPSSGRTGRQVSV